MNPKYNQLEFNKVKKLIAAYCDSTLGADFILAIKPSQQLKEIDRKLTLVMETKDLLINNIRYNFNQLASIEKLLIDFEHPAYHFDEFKKIVRNIKIANRVKEDEENFVSKEQFKLLIDNLVSLNKLEKRYGEIFDEEGEIKDNASRELRTIRSSYNAVRKNLYSTLKQKKEELSQNNFLAEDIITRRDNRYVLLIKENSSHFIEGMAHGKSGSGSSVYMEPKKVVSINNQLEMLLAEENIEIKRILQEFTYQIKAYRKEIIKNTEILQKLDAYYAQAKYSVEYKTIKPELSEKAVLNFVNASHPLLLANYKNKEDVIPFNLKLGTDFRFIIISGPNTGGKTVLLKAAGLLTLMTMSGIPIPAAEGTKIGIFNQVFSDIGDEQSLENSLSTFSSHIEKIKEIIFKADEKSLVLIDEIGAATDPEQGSALAMAILEKLTSLKIVGMVTTHYTALKLFAEKHPACINAAMQFDDRKHIPTYRMKMGLPGNSFAIKVAERLGFPKTLIKRAEELAGSENVDLSNLLTKLNREKIELSRKIYEHDLKTSLLQKKADEYQSKIEQIEAEKKSIRKQEISKIREKYIDLQRELNEELTHIKQLEKDKRKKELLQKSFDKVTRINQDLKSQTDEYKVEQKQKVKEPKVGQNVWIKGINTEGEIIEIDGKSIKVDIGGIYFTTEPDKLYTSKQKSTESKIVSHGKIPRKRAKIELNVVGNRFNEALPKLEDFLDNAIVSGLKKVRIIHGKGTGALRSKIRNYISKNNKIEKFYSPAPEAGGSGVTVVNLK